MTYRIDDNWHVAGLAGTGSKDIVVDGAFVPDHRSMSHWDLTLGKPMPGWELNPAPLYRLPFAVVFINALSAAIIGAAAGFLDAWIESSRERKGGMGLKIAEDPYSQELVAQSSYTIKSAALKFLNDCSIENDGDQARAGAPIQRSCAVPNCATTRRAQPNSPPLPSIACSRVRGGHAIFFDHPLQRRFQDITAMTHHTAMNPDPAARLCGSAQLGVPILDLFV